MSNTVRDGRRVFRPVWSCMLDRLSWASGATAAQTVALPYNVIIRGFMTTVSDNTGNRTVTVTFADADGYTISTNATIAENASTFTEDTAYLDGTCKVIVTPSGDPGTGGMTVDITLYGE